MQRSGSEAIGTQIQPSKPKWEITNITNSQNTKENIWLKFDGNKCERPVW